MIIVNDYYYYCYYYPGVGFYVPMFHITQLLGRFHLQQIFEGHVQNPQKGTFTNPC